MTEAQACPCPALSGALTASGKVGGKTACGCVQDGGQRTQLGGASGPAPELSAAPLSPRTHQDSQADRLPPGGLWLHRPCGSHVQEPAGLCRGCPGAPGTLAFRNAVPRLSFSTPNQTVDGIRVMDNFLFYYFKLFISERK